MEYDRHGVNYNWFGLWLSSGGKFHFRVGADTKDSIQTLNPNQWYFLAATFDASDKTMRLYVDGQFDSSQNQSTGYNSPRAAKLTIGTYGFEDDEYFNGQIDDIRIYKVALTPQEIQNLFENR